MATRDSLDDAAPQLAPPHRRRAALSSAREDGAPQESLLEEYFRTLKRHRRLVLLSAGCGLLLALLAALWMQPVYETRTSLDIRSLNTDFLNMRSVDPTGNGSADEANTNLQTQIKLLESDALLDEVKSRLLSAPHPATVQQGASSRARGLLHLGGVRPMTYEELVDDTAKRTKVKPVGLSRLVEVSCQSVDRTFAATFCNTLTRTFTEQDYQTRMQEAQNTQNFLSQQAVDVRQRAADSQRKLEVAVGGNGLMLSQTTTSPGEDRLHALEEELVKAQGDRMEKEAAADVARKVPAESLPEVQDNPAYRAYQLKLADLHQQLSLLVPTLTEQNPKVIKLRAQIADAEAGLRAVVLSSTERGTNEYAAATHREQLLDITLRAQQSTVSADLQKAAQVSLLRKEMEGEQTLYQTLMERAKEAGFASAMHAATIRVVDTAKPPRFASSPRRGLMGAAGLAFGGVFGLGLAFYRERSQRVLRLPGEASQLLELHELGVIPASARLRSGTSLERGLARQDASGAVLAETRWNEPFSLAAEAYRNTTLSILLTDRGRPTRSYVVSSPNAGEGKTTVTSNLGVALSKSKMRVVLVDGDLRRPKLHKAFSVSNRFGMRNILRGEVDLDVAPVATLVQRTALPNVSVIPAGEGDEDVVGLLQSDTFNALLTRLGRDFDAVLIDSPPILHLADARVLAHHADGAILIFRSGRTTREQASFALDLFERDGVRVVGTILNGFDPVREGEPDYYSSYTRYRQGDEAAAREGARA